MRQRTLIIHCLLYTLAFLWAGYTYGPAIAALNQPSNQPALTIGTITTAAGSTATLPVAFQSNGASIGALSFSLTFDDTCLTYNSHALAVPATHSASSVFTADLDNDTLIDTLDVLLFAFSPTPIALPATLTPLLTLTMTAKAACTGVTTAVIFSGNVSFSDAVTTLTVSGAATDGAVTIGDTVTPTPTLTPTPTGTPVAGATLLLVSAGQSGSIDGISFRDEDILAYNPATKGWAMFFDGSDVGLGNVDLEAFETLTDGSLLLTLSKALAIPGLGTVMPADILRFTARTLGTNTTGSFAWYFDGSDVDLTTTSESIDALAVDQRGHLLISTGGALTIGNATLGEDEDLFLFAPTRVGADTAGAWSLYLDGTRVALTKSEEDLDAAWFDPRNGDLYLSTKGKFSAIGSVNALSGGKNDLFICTPLAIAAATNCRFALFFSGSHASFKYDIDDLSIVTANSSLLASTRSAHAESFVNDTVDTLNQYPVVAPETGEAYDDPELTAVDQDEEAALIRRILLPIIRKQ